MTAFSACDDIVGTQIVYTGSFGNDIGRMTVYSITHAEECRMKCENRGGDLYMYTWNNFTTVSTAACSGYSMVFSSMAGPSCVLLLGKREDLVRAGQTCNMNDGCVSGLCPSMVRLWDCSDWTGWWIVG